MTQIEQNSEFPDSFAPSIHYPNLIQSIMKKLILTLVVVVCCVFAAQSQDYKSAIGLRLGYPLSVSYKTFISDPGAIEVFAGFRSYAYLGWFNVGAMYEHHLPIASVSGLKWYFGGGAAVYFWHYDNGYPDADSNTSFSILGNLGLDYKFASAPVNLSVDWVPTFFLNGYGDGFAGGYGALSVRYTLK